MAFGQFVLRLYRERGCPQSRALLKGKGGYKESRPPDTRAITWSAVWPGARHPSVLQSLLEGELGASRDWRQGKDDRASGLEGAQTSHASPLPLQVSGL